MTGTRLGAITLPGKVEIRDVGPRDGLQVEQPLSVAQRVALIQALADAGIRHIEVGSFVSARAVPSMAATDEVCTRLGPLADVTVTGLAPNLRGARDAIASGVDEITITLSASEEYGRRNINMTLAESLDQVEAICLSARAANVRTDAVISCAFGSPYEGEISPSDVADLIHQVRRRGCDRITLADTTGLATPRRVFDVIQEVGQDIGLHFHESRGTGLTNVFAAMAFGASRFDSSTGGLGGSPFTEGAAGNVATEDLVSMLDDMHVTTGIRLNALLAASALLSEYVQHALPSAVATLEQKPTRPVASAG